MVNCVSYQWKKQCLKRRMVKCGKVYIIRMIEAILGEQDGPFLESSLVKSVIRVIIGE